MGQAFFALGGVEGIGSTWKGWRSTTERRYQARQGVREETHLMLSNAEIESARRAVASTLLKTPVLALSSARWQTVLPEGIEATLKLELFQQSGSFKARGAFLGIAGMDPAAQAAGVAAASGGNHAMAVSWAAAAKGVSAKIAIPQSADPLRIEACRQAGAEVVLCDDIKHAFAQMQAWVDTEDRLMMHPFEGEHMSLGSATLGAEYVEQCPDLDAFVVPVGGGGLISGMAAAIKLARPEALVFGVEPEGANSMQRSLAAGEPIALDGLNTIADSLASPLAMPYSFGLARACVDEVVTVSDEALRASMRHLQDTLRIVAEPACAASLAALIGPLGQRLAGRRVGLLACGSNIGLKRYHALLGEP
ncbi:MAG: pyridoxal-phosphate dependent enzyme [Pseudomonadota bacterium]